ncbi:FCD domain-containing protein [Frankia sp. R82]|uniref:FCD domain-containing protein n=1 Tax=Frankia sp. R82 TaxID=2950553 RepID=UPI0020444331|nr:FCD domain-containing protein [Frankia sp. R82]MCM3883403.1 FCD domain-containing protein [Frankia sp. R82]
MVAAAHNPILAEVGDSFVPRTRRTLIYLLCLCLIPDRQVDRDLHRELVEAIAGHAPNAAARRGRTHLELLTEGMA